MSRNYIYHNPAGYLGADPHGGPDSVPANVVDPTSYGTVIASYNGGAGIVEAGAGIDTWEDLFGAGNDVQQTTDADRPSLSLADVGFNGKDVVLFDGTEFIGRATFVSGSQAQPTTVVLVHKLATTTGQLTYFDGPTSRNMAQNVGGTASMYAGSAVMNLWSANTSLHLEVFIFNGASNIAYKDGVLDTPSGSAGTDGMNGINIGANASDVNLYNGKMAALTVFDGLLSDANMNGYMNELAAFYGGTWSDI